MSLAYNQAIEAWRADEVPIGAVIEIGGEIVGSAHNTVEGAKDPTAHAEMLALTQAAAKLGDWRLAGGNGLRDEGAVPDVLGRHADVPREARVLRRARPEDGLPRRRDESQRPSAREPPCRADRRRRARKRVPRDVAGVFQAEAAGRRIGRAHYP